MIVKLKCIRNSTGITRYACQSPHVVKREEFCLYGLYLDLIKSTLFLDIFSLKYLPQSNANNSCS